MEEPEVKSEEKTEEKLGPEIKLISETEALSDSRQKIILFLILGLVLVFGLVLTAYILGWVRQEKKVIQDRTKQADLAKCSEDEDCLVAIKLDECCSCPTAVLRQEVLEDGNLVEYEFDRDYSQARKVNCSDVVCMPCAGPPQGTVCFEGQCQLKLPEIYDVPWKNGQQPGVTVETYNGRCANRGDKSAGTISLQGEMITFTGMVSTAATPCDSLEAFLEESNSEMAIVLVNKGHEGNCDECIGTVNFSGTLTGLKAGNYNVRLIQRMPNQEILFDQKELIIRTAQDSAEGKFCGGIAANLPEFQCPASYRCQLEGNYPDAGGKCVKE